MIFGLDEFQLVVYGVVIGLGLILGRSVYKSYEDGKKGENLTHVPLVGALLNVNGWMPKTGHDKNIILGKIITVAYVIFANFYPIMWVFVGVSIVYHLDYFKENV